MNAQAIHLSPPRTSGARPSAIVRAIVTVFSGLALPLPAHPVGFSDPQLEQVIRDTLVIPSGELTESDLLNLYELDATDRGIRSLEGLQHCPNLIRLTLSFNDVTDLAPLASLSALQELNLWWNPVSDLSALSSLPLSSLDIRNTSVTDLSPLTTVFTLQSLKAYQTPICEIQSLAALPILSELDIGCTWFLPMAAYYDLEDFPSLRTLGLSYSDLTTIDFLAPLTSLTRLDLEGNHVSAVQFRTLTALTQLEVLDISENGIADISALSTPQLHNRRLL